MWRIIILYIFMDLATAQIFRGNLTNHALIKIHQSTSRNLADLNLFGVMINNLTYKNEPVYTGDGYVFLVKPEYVMLFVYLSTKMKLCPEVMTENFPDWIEATERDRFASSFDFTRYKTLEEIYRDLKKIYNKFRYKMLLYSTNKSFEGRNITGIQLFFKQGNPGIFLEGGIHGNEWISPTIVMYILVQVLTSNDPNIRELAERHTWFFFPLFNPDGYAYTHNSSNRNWGKNLRKYEKLPCFGVDLDRNWDHKRNYTPYEGNLSEISCANDFPGVRPFSEPETDVLRSYISFLVRKKFYAYISLRSFGQYLLYPYCYTTNNSKDYDVLEAIAKKTAETLTERSGKVYRTGSVAEIIGESPGCTLDYIHDILEKHLVFQYRLGHYNDIEVPPEDIISTGDYVLHSLVVMFREAKAYGYPKIS